MNKLIVIYVIVFSSVQSLSCVWLFVIPWTAACQASLSITNSQSLLKLVSIESVMPSNHLMLCCPLLPPSVFLVGSPCSPRDSQESSPTPQFKSINYSVLRFHYGSTPTSLHGYWKSIGLTIWNFVSKVISLLFNMLSRLVIALLPRSKRLLIS